MTRKLILAVVAMTALVAIPASVSAEERPPTQRPTIALTLATTGMAEVRQPFRIAASLPPKAEGVVAALQVRSSSGFVTQQRVGLDARGRGSGLVVSNRPAERTYRAVLLSARGRVLATSPSITVAWVPLQHTASLTCASSTAPIGVDIPCTITVGPLVKLDGMLASLQSMGPTGWFPLEAVRVPAKGVIETHVEGITAGVGMYRVLLLREAKVIAESPTISIEYSTP